MPSADSTPPPPARVVGSPAVGSPAHVAAPPPEDPEADPRTRGREADPHDWARQIVLRQLTAAPRSRAQLEQVLRRRNCPDAIAAAVLDRMEEVGLVDDTAYAGMVIRSQQASRGLARRALAQELHRKGVDVGPGPGGADPPARRHARPQGVPGRAVDAHRARGGPRGARAPARLR